MSRLAVAVAAFSLTGCALQDTSTPVPQGDALILGRLAEVRPVAGEPGTFEVDIRAGVPESLQAVMRREGRPVPELQKDLAVRVRVTPDTVCIHDHVATDLSAFRAGEEVAVLPQPGTSAMIGTRLLTAEAAEFNSFLAYETRFLPRALDAIPTAALGSADPARINSGGTERTPIPVAGGKVVYFAAGLKPGSAKGDAPRGAVRPRMKRADGTLAPWAVGGYRPYRVAWVDGRWGVPQPVELPGLGEAASATVTWASTDETALLAEIVERGKPPRLAAASRASTREPWGALQPVAGAPSDGAGDAQRFGSRGLALVWTVYEAGTSDLWLLLEGKDGQRLEPRINTLGAEWAPRVGPGTSLYFCRFDRQLVFRQGMVQEVRLPGAQRHPLLEAVPTADGALLFCRVPTFGPGEPDWDLAVAAKAGEGWGAAVRLDEWRPAGA